MQHGFQRLGFLLDGEDGGLHAFELVRLVEGELAAFFRGGRGGGCLVPGGGLAGGGLRLDPLGGLASLAFFQIVGVISRLHRDAVVLEGDDLVSHPLEPGRTAYLHLIRGELTVNGTRLSGGDALKFSGEDVVTASEATSAEFLLFDLPY